ncbi:FTSJ1 [Symbiodinium microadriaticum]|nr:FTSJ1 [Symbiodinium microadriaticum]
MDCLLLGHRYDESSNTILGLSNVVVPFVACGDLHGFDADKSYPLQLTALPDTEGDKSGTAAAAEGYVYSYHKPVQPPIRPNYYMYQQTTQQMGSAKNPVEKQNAQS